MLKLRAYVDESLKLITDETPCKAEVAEMIESVVADIERGVDRYNQPG